MTEKSLERVETRLIELAEAYPYPPTPDIAGAVARRLAWSERPRRRRFVPRLAWAVVLLLVLSAALLSVPGVRAEILEFIQVGVIRIFLAEPTPTPGSLPTPGGAAAETPTPGSRPFTGIPDSQSSSTPTAPAFNLDGRTTLVEAASRVTLPIKIPYSGDEPDLPDEVFLQDLGGQALVLVWLDPQPPGQVLFSLHILEPGDYSIEKIQPIILERTTVNGETAYWTNGPYMLRLKNRVLDTIRLVEGHVLMWTEGEITYRLESNLSLEEAVRLAESLRVFTQEKPATIRPR